jgi:exosortase H (IPTLxxWG-CTERM-specific)
MALSRRQIGFLVRFALLCLFFYIPIAIPAVERVTVAPFTRGLATLSGAILHLLGQNTTTTGTTIRSAEFGVDVKNGCNAVEAVAFLAAAILAFEAPIALRIIGAILGSIILEALNLIRIVTLYLLGRYHRNLFDMFHLAVWQSVMFGVAVLIFLIWTSRATKHAVANR